VIGLAKFKLLCEIVVRVGQGKKPLVLLLYVEPRGQLKKLSGEVSLCSGLGCNIGPSFTIYLKDSGIHASN